MCTSDYFNRCNTYVVNVPNNFWGYQDAYQGDGYVGLVPSEWNSGVGEYLGFEYIQTKLLQPLIPCYSYHFSMQVSLANYSKYAYTKLGALFTEDQFYINNCDAITETPQVLNTSIFLNDTLNWMTVEGDFTATGNERFLSIGFFYDNVINDTLFFQDVPLFPNDVFGYYYIDNVSVVEIGEVEDCGYDLPNVFTPNDDGENDLWEYNSPIEGHLEILNRWGTTVYENNGYLHSWNGDDCVDGVYFYTFDSEQLKRTGFIQLIR